MANISQSRIFISYSHRGDGPEWKAWLVRHLGVFEHHHLLDVWQDGKIRVSSYWDDDIKQAMSNARLAVVLLTKEVLESEYILNTEFPFLRARQRRDKLPVFPVVCEPCDWKGHDWLRATQAPNESNPLSRLSEAARDRIFRKLATDIAKELSRVALAELSKLEQPPTAALTCLDKFPLACRSGQREEELIGREQELALLDLALAQRHTAIVSLIAWGGVGKTMLVRHWLQHLQCENWFGARRVYGWSFYSQGTKEDRQASEDTFLARALEWFGVKCEPTLSPWDKGRLLAEAVARERTLLILDGIEPLQYPPGPMGGQLRAPGVQSLLKQLARKANAAERCGLCLVTTREPLTDLADFQRREGSPWGSVLRVDLGSLTDEAGAALLHHAGANRAGAAEVKPDDKELLAASREVDGHALTLNLLGRFLARAHGGDIRRRDLVKFEEADRKEQGGTTFRMLAAFENWFARSGEFGARQLAILRILGLFDRPADAGCIAALREPPAIAGLTDPLFAARMRILHWPIRLSQISGEDWNTAVSFLCDFGLVTVTTWRPSGNQGWELDCHPLIREYFAVRFAGRRPRAWRAAHYRLFEHLKANTPDKPDTLEGLRPLYEAVAHACRGGAYNQAWHKVLNPRIFRGAQYYSFENLGSCSSDLSAMTCFFDRAWTVVTGVFSTREKGCILGITGFLLRGLGRLSEARETMVASIDLDIESRDWRNSAIGTGNLSDIDMTLGLLPDAMRDAEQSVDFARRSGHIFEQARSYSILANVLHQMRRRAEALACFQKAEGMQSKYHKDELAFLYSVRGFWYCDLLLSDAERAAWQSTWDVDGKSKRACGLDFAGVEDASSERSVDELQCFQRVQQHAEQGLRIANQGGWLLDAALNSLTLGRLQLYRAILGKSEIRSARPATQQAVEGLHHAGDITYLARSLLTRAWLRVLEGDSSGARADLDEAWDIAERGPMRLHMADIHLHRARLLFRERHYPWKSPQDDLAAAERLIKDCGYHRRDEELADAKKAILGQ